MSFLAWSAEAESVAAAANFYVGSLPNKRRQLRKNYDKLSDHRTPVRFDHRKPSVRF
jgi:hypothetical protein